MGEDGVTAGLAADLDARPKAAGRQFWNSNPCGGRWASYAEFLDWYRAAIKT